MKSWNELLAAVEAAKPEAEKVAKGNKSAVIRMRKQLQIIAIAAKQARKDASAVKNAES